MRCTCNTAVIAELEELATWCDEQARMMRIEVGDMGDGWVLGMTNAHEGHAEHIRSIITRRRASIQPVRYQETER
jgi:hypothetical protein